MLTARRSALAARCNPQAGEGMNILALLSRTKLYWGLLLIFAIGVLFSPVTSSGRNIFLSHQYGANLL